MESPANSFILEDYQDTQKCCLSHCGHPEGLWEDPPKAQLAGQSTTCQISTTK